MAGPPGLTDVVRTFYAVAGPLPFELRLKELPDCKGEFEVPAGCVQAFPLKHRVPCCGYAFTLPRAGKFDPQRAKAAGIPVRYWSTLQSGQPVGGFLPSQVLGPRRGLKVVYATDTRPCAALRRAAQDADLLLMDSTYADDADLPKAKLYGHSTCRETGGPCRRSQRVPPVADPLQRRRNGPCPPALPPRSRRSPPQPPGLTACG